MGAIREPRPVLLLVAAFSRYNAALAWGRQRAEAQWGPVALESELFPFTDTQFYEQEMGRDLQKCFWAFQSLIDPAQLPSIKHQTNDWEREYAASAAHVEPRPLNLDPGYISEAKLVLATTKDRDHRLYLSQGIYAEGTLFFHKGQWQCRPWTYPDYRSQAYHAFFDQCRSYLRNRYRSGETGTPSAT